MWAIKVPKIKADAAVSTPIRRASTSIITSTTAGNSVASSPTKDSRPLAPLPQSPRRGTALVESAHEFAVPIPVPLLTAFPVHSASSTSASGPSTTPIKVVSESLSRAELSILSPATNATKTIEPMLYTVDSHNSLISNVMNLDSSLSATVKPAGAENLSNKLHQKDIEGSDRRTSPKNVTSAELSDALLLMKYDFHRELQTLMREQVRQFAIAKVRIFKMSANAFYYVFYRLLIYQRNFIDFFLPSFFLFSG